jgi:hypothetical protein
MFMMLEEGNYHAYSNLKICLKKKDATFTSILERRNNKENESILYVLCSYETID